MEKKRKWIFELLSTLEEYGINIIITRIDREKIRTIKGIKYIKSI